VKVWKLLAKLPLEQCSVDLAQDEVFEVIATIPTLKSLASTALRKDRQVAFFRNHPGLQSLVVTTDAVTDESVASIVSLKKLASLNIKGSKITPAGFEQLKKALPKCRIESDHGTYEPK
jgi:hypothetical protein